MELFERFRNTLRHTYPAIWALFPYSRSRSSSDDSTHQGKFIFPSESERHEATIMGFPSRCSLPSDKYEDVCNELAHLALTIAEFEPVRLYVRPEDVQLAESLVQNNARNNPRIRIIPCPINHCWVRDTGPVYVRDTTGAFPSRRFAINFRFNEWGDKRPEDDGVCWGQK